MSKPPKSKKQPKPYDTLFRRSLQEKKVATDLLRSHLPAELVAEMDLSTLTLLNNDPVLQGLDIVYADCVYSCTIREKLGYIVTLCEHQSTAHKMMAFRFLQYIVGIMGNHIRQGHEKLPIVLPIVLYHGKSSPYPYSTEIWDCFELPDLAKQWALKTFQLIDLTVMSDEEIQKHGLSSAMEFIFKHCRKRDALHWLKQLINSEKLRIIYSEVGRLYFLDISHSMQEVSGDKWSAKDRDEFLQLLADVIPEEREAIMTFAQQFRQEGLQQGLQQGEHRKAFEIAKKMLAKGADISDIEELTELSYEEIASL